MLIYPDLKNWQVLYRNLLYDEAQQLEEAEAILRGCDYSAGGEFVPGRVWSVYLFEY